MLVDSWPLNLFALLSLAITIFAAIAYGIGCVIDRRERARHKSLSKAANHFERCGVSNE